MLTSYGSVDRRGGGGAYGNWKKNKDGGNTLDPFADVAINNAVNGHVSPTVSTSPAVDHSQAELTKVGFSLKIFFV